MNLPDFGKDSLDQYSIPTHTKKTNLYTLYQMPVRENENKPGRTLAIMWDKRKPLVVGFENNHSYTVTFKNKGNKAGNHYHKNKQEIFYPISGDLTIAVEDVNSKEREEIILRTEDHKALYVPVNVAHAVRAENKEAVILIIATSPGVEGDEFPYEVL